MAEPRTQRHKPQGWVFRHVAWGLLLEKDFNVRKTHYESEAYNSGWLTGYDALVVELYKGFDGTLPAWLLEVIGGKRAVNSALKSKPQDDDFMFDSDYDDGETDGFDELLEDVVEAFKEKEIEMPMFLKLIVDDTDPLKPSGALGS